MQFSDRLKWYEAKFAADDMPDWNAATLVSAQQIAPGLKAVVLSVEISRERVPLRNAYKCAGQKASVRVNSGIEYTLSVASAPFPQALNRDPLFKIRGDLFANEIKIAKTPISVMAELHLLVSKEEAPEVIETYATDAALLLHPLPHLLCCLRVAFAFDCACA